MECVRSGTARKERGPSRREASIEHSSGELGAPCDMRTLPGRTCPFCDASLSRLERLLDGLRRLALCRHSDHELREQQQQQRRRNAAPYRHARRRPFAHVRYVCDAAVVGELQRALTRRAVPFGLPPRRAEEGPAQTSDGALSLSLSLSLSHTHTRTLTA